jgi:hypothetical protein
MKRDVAVAADSPRHGIPAFLYASGGYRHTLVNLFLTISSLFLILKDLQRKRLAVRLTGASARSNPYIYEEK